MFAAISSRDCRSLLFHPKFPLDAKIDSPEHEGNRSVHRSFGWTIKKHKSRFVAETIKRKRAERKENSEPNHE